MLGSCPRCGRDNVDESEISAEWKCNDCDFIWGRDQKMAFYYFSKWNVKTGLPGPIGQVPEGCLWVGHTSKAERKESRDREDSCSKHSTS
jgi:hypothetical protein